MTGKVVSCRHVGGRLRMAASLRTITSLPSQWPVLGSNRLDGLQMRPPPAPKAPPPARPAPPTAPTTPARHRRPPRVPARRSPRPPSAPHPLIRHPEAGPCRLNAYFVFSDRFADSG